MSEPTAGEEAHKRTSVVIRKIDQERLHRLIVALHTETNIAPNEQDVIRVALFEACKARGIDPTQVGGAS